MELFSHSDDIIIRGQDTNPCSYARAAVDDQPGEDAPSEVHTLGSQQVFLAVIIFAERKRKCLPVTPLHAGITKPNLLLLWNLQIKDTRLKSKIQDWNIETI